MNIDFIRVFGFEPALIGMRNPMNSWSLSDSIFYDNHEKFNSLTKYGYAKTPEMPSIGERDIDLACKLIRSGTEHRKFLRQIMIWVRITAPRYLWQEIDTYKVATDKSANVRNSCSTMNKLGTVNLEQIDFEEPIEDNVLQHLNLLGEALRKTRKIKNKNKIKELRSKIKNDLPEGYLQQSMYMMSYETALSMIIHRETHRLNQWKIICNFLKELPYMNLFYDAAMFKKNKIRKIIEELDEISKSSELNQSIKNKITILRNELKITV